MTRNLFQTISVGVPPILAGQVTGDVRKRVEHFLFSVASIFESWVAHGYIRYTHRVCREDVMAFVNFFGIAWPDRRSSSCVCRLRT